MLRTSKYLAALICGILLFGSLILHAESDDLLFYASFDNGFDADVAKGGNPVALKPPSLRLVPGIKGKAVLVKGTKDTVQYSAASCINGEEGTFSFWAKPVNWTPSTKNFVFLVGANAVSGTDRHDLWVFKNRRTSDIQFFARKRNTKNASYSFGVPQPTWQTGKWHQFVTTWKGKIFKCYIDGKEVGVRGGPELPDAGWRKIRIGFLGGSWPSIGDEATAIDDVRIFKKQLSPEEINSEYKKVRGMLKKRAAFKNLPLEKRVCFYADFENNINNLCQDKSNPPAVIRGSNKELEYISGVIGKAVVLNGPDKSSLHFSVPKALKAKSGTCSIWIKPIDWDAKDQKVQFFVSFFYPGSQMLLYKRNKSNKASLLFQNTKNPRQTALTEKPIAWTKGKWHNMAFTWDNTGYSLYIDGEFCGSRPTVEISKIWKDLYLGTSLRSWGNAISTGKTAFDQWIILPYVMSDSEIKEQYINTVMGNPELKKQFEETRKKLDFKVQNNLALAKNGCFVLASSFENYHKNYPDKLIDGKVDSIWHAKDIDPEQWIQLHWKMPVKLNKIVLMPSPDCGKFNYQVLAKAEDKWIKLKEGTSNNTDIEFPATETNCVRVYLKSKKAVRLAEVEAYGPPQAFLGRNRAYWEAMYVWYPEDRNVYIANSPRYFRKVFELDNMNFENAYVQARSNDHYVIYVNGHKVASGSTIIKPYKVSQYLKKGKNVIAAIADLKSTPGRWGFGEFLAELSINYANGSKRIGTDKSWKSFNKKVFGWNKADFDDSKWKKVACFKAPPCEPWGDIPYYCTAVRENAPLKDISIFPANSKPGEKIKISMVLQPKIPLGRNYFFVFKIGEKIIDPRMGGWVISKKIFEPNKPTSESGKNPIKISTEMYLPEYTPGGKLPIRVEAFDTKTGIQLDLVTKGEKTDTVGYVNVAQKLAKEPIDKPVVAKVAFPDNQSAFEINGKMYPPFYWKNHWITSPLHYFNQNKAGINTFHLTIHGHIVDADKEARKHYFGILDQQLSHLIRTCPDAWIMIDIDLRPTSAWLAANPDERLVNAFGDKGPVCYASKKYIEDSKEALDAFFAYFKNKQYYNRIVMIQPMSLGKMDSGLGGCEMNVYQTNRSKLTVGDYNPQAIEMFRNFLRKKYKNNVQALRSAWKKPKVTFETAYPNIKELSAESADGGAFRDPSKGCMPFDYAEFLPNLLSNWYRIMAAKIKKDTDRRVMVLIHYGYIMTHLRAFNCPGDVWNNNDYDFPELLKDDNIDGYIGAPDYDNRLAQHSYMLYFPYSSIKLHKRIYTADGDYRTFVAAPKTYGRHHGARESRAMLERDMGSGICRSTGAWLSDMARGAHETRSSQSWFLEDSILTTIREMVKLYRKAIKVGYKQTCDIAVIVSTDQPHFNDWYHSMVMMNNLIGETYFKEIGKVGAPYDVYMIDDLRHPDIRKDYKLYIVLNPFYLKQEDRQALENLKKNGKTILWFYAPDYIDIKDGLVTDNISKLTGIKVAKKPEKEHIVAAITDNSHPITSYVKKGHGVKVLEYEFAISRKMYPKEFGPVFYIDDPKAKILARYKNDNKGALAVRDFGTWKSIYCAVPRLDAKMLRGIAEYAGVNIYIKENIAMDANRNFVVVSNSYHKERELTVNLPCKANVSDALTGEPVADNVKKFKVKMPKCYTKIFFLEPVSK